MYTLEYYTHHFFPKIGDFLCKYFSHINSIHWHKSSLFSADFGVSAISDKTIQKRDSFIGTPYWYVFSLHHFETCCQFFIVILSNINR